MQLQLVALPAPKGKIPKKKADQQEVTNRLDRLEALMTTQYERNEEFKENIMSVLSVERHHVQQPQGQHF